MDWLMREAWSSREKTEEEEDDGRGEGQIDSSKKRIDFLTIARWSSDLRN